MVEVTRRDKSEEEKKVIEEVRKTGAQWMGEERWKILNQQNQQMVKGLI